jgi:DNA-binding LacI/PurR family transcriptional regulator
VATTLDDVAKRSGYFPAIISRVVNGSDGVRSEVRIAVEKAIRELGYVTHKSKQNANEQLIEVILHRSGMVEQVDAGPGGLAVGPLTPVQEETILTPAWQGGNEFHLRILNGILGELKTWGGKAILQVVTDLNDHKVVDSLAPDVSGVLIVGEGGPGVGALAAACKRPVVLVDMLDPQGALEQVTTDNFAGIGQAVDHLVGLGHQSLGFIGGGDLPANRERSLAFAFHAARHGVRVPADWREVPYEHIGPTAEHLKVLLGQPGRPTGVVCCNDWGALALVRAADAAGLRLPRDLSIVGFDDISMIAMTTPPITSVRVSCEALGGMAVRMLLSRRGRIESQPCTLRLHPRLIVRGSTAAPPV